MYAKLIAVLTCAAALSLGACSGSGNNASGTTGGGGDRPGAGSGTDGGGGGGNGNGNGGTDGSGGGGGNPDGNGDGGADPTPLQTAEKQRADAKIAADAAIEAASLAVSAGTEGARDNAETLIRLASTALDDAVKAAEEAERKAAADGSAAQFGAATRAGNRARDLRAEQMPLLDGALDSLAWWGRALARYELANGEAVTPREGTNVVTINRIPRTRTAAGGGQERNPKAFCLKSLTPEPCEEDTFKTVMHEDGKKLFSDVDVEFKVDGYAQLSFSAYALAREEYVLTGVKLTRGGLVIRTGGGKPPGVDWTHADFTDVRRNLAYRTDDTNRDGQTRLNDGLPGQNGWDLEITFDAPRTMPVPDAPDGRNWVASWQGNGDFYWKAIVPAAKSQLETDGDYYESDAFLQPDGYKDLGTYEVWLSNHVGVDRNLEPAAGREITCPNGLRGTSCPEDDEQLYLEYAAYGLFVYTADPETFRAYWPNGQPVGTNGRQGRVQGLSFGYSAFADENDKRTTDIGEPITGGKFQGHALAYAFKGTNSLSNEFKMLRGDATLTVTIPKTGDEPGTIEGNLNNFKEWTDAGWTAYGTNFNVNLGNARISDAGVFSGATTSTGTVNDLQSSAGLFRGALYGPRDNSDDLEVAGSWTMGTDFRGGANTDASRWEIIGSFGAKQRPTATPGS